MKNAICTGIGVVGSFIASLFGGWTASLTTLLIFMGVDYLTGLIVVGDEQVVAFMTENNRKARRYSGLKLRLEQEP